MIKKRLICSSKANKNKEPNKQIIFILFYQKKWHDKKNSII